MLMYSMVGPNVTKGRTNQFDSMVELLYEHFEFPKKTYVRNLGGMVDVQADHSAHF